MKILVRGPNWAGDLVMSTPGFRALRAGFPEARITLHVRAGLELLVSGAPWFDQVIAVESYRAGGLALLREGWGLRRRGGFDLGLCIPESVSSALLMRAAGVRHVVGYRSAGRGLLLHQPVAPPSEWGRDRLVPRELFVLGLMTAVGCQGRGSELELFTTDEEERGASVLLEQRGIDPGRSLVALAPGASYGPSKHWPASSFARVGDAAARAGASVILLGTSAERSLTAGVRSRMTEGAVDLAGALDLGVLKAVIRRTTVLVCNDAGARHIAGAFGVPCTVLFGPTSLEKTSLNLERVTVLETDVECRPCYLRECPIDHRCMTRIEDHRAIEPVLAALETKPDAAR